MTIGGIDLGSAWLAAVVAADDLPARWTEEPRTFAVDPRDLDVVVAVVVELFIKSGVTRAAIEFGRFYSGESPSAGQATAMGNAWGIMHTLEHLFGNALRAAGIEVLTMARRTWSSRLVPHHQGGISTADSNAGVEAKCAEGEYARLLDQHQRDAAGVLLGAWLVDPERRRRHQKYRDRRKDPTAPRPPELTPEERKLKQLIGTRERVRRCRIADATRDGPGYHRPLDATSEERAAAGCACSAKHRRDCPIYQRRAAERGEHEPRLRGYVPGAIPPGKSYLR